MPFLTPKDGKVDDSRLVPGCWVTSGRFGPAVLISIEPDFFILRYRSRHLATGETLWVQIGDDRCEYLRRADDESRHVLTLEGSFGLGPGRSDPRM